MPLPSQLKYHKLMAPMNLLAHACGFDADKHPCFLMTPCSLFPADRAASMATEGGVGAVLQEAGHCCHGLLPSHQGYQTAGPRPSAHCPEVRILLGVRVLLLKRVNCDGSNTPSHQFHQTIYSTQTFSKLPKGEWEKVRELELWGVA